MSAPIHGFAKKGFEKIKYTFEENFTKRNEIGASCCIYYKGEKVVDLWGGYKDKNKTDEWKEDTLAIVFSTTKGLSSLAFSLLHSKGFLDYDEKVATYWKEFAANGKEDITVRQLLSHQAGLFATDKELNCEVLTDEERLSDYLATQKPFWNPGDHKGYHAWTVGMYQNELCKRIDPQHRPLHIFFQEEIADKLSADFYIGLNESLQTERIAEMIPFKRYELLTKGMNGNFYRSVKAILNPFSLFYKALFNVPHARDLDNFNDRKYTMLPLGSAHGFGNARSIAQIYNEFVTGGKNLGIRKETLMLVEASPDYPKKGKLDIISHVDIPISLGLTKSSNYQHFGVNDRSYGAFGAGGSGGFADPEKQVAFGYVMNRMGTFIANDPRELALRKATYECIAEIESSN